MYRNFILKIIKSLNIQWILIEIKILIILHFKPVRIKSINFKDKLLIDDINELKRIFKILNFDKKFNHLKKMINWLLKRQKGKKKSEFLKIILLEFYIKEINMFFWLL